MCFQAQYEPGTLTAVAYTESGEEDARTELRTAGSETQLSVEVEEGTKELFLSI